MRQREQDPEEHRQARATQVVRIPDDAHGMPRRPVRDVDQHLRRVGVRVAIGDEQEVRGRLRRVADRVRAGVAQAFRHPSLDERGKPAEYRADDQQRSASGPLSRLAARRAEVSGAQPGERGRDEQRRQYEQEPKEDRPATLSNRLFGQLHVDRVLPGFPHEAGIGVGHEREICGEVRLVADVAAHHSVEPGGRAAGEDRDHPVDDAGDDDPDRPEREPDEVWNREQQSEEDRDPRALVVVLDDEVDRMRFVHRPSIRHPSDCS